MKHGVSTTKKRDYRSVRKFRNTLTKIIGKFFKSNKKKIDPIEGYLHPEAW